MALVLVVAEEEELFWTPQHLLQHWRIENKEEELLETNSLEREELVSCNQIQMIPNVAVSLNWKLTMRTKMWFLGAQDLTDPEHATPGPTSLEKGSS